MGSYSKKVERFLISIFMVIPLLLVGVALAGTCRSLSSSATTLTTEWQDIGSEMEMGNVDSFDLQLCYDVNNGSGLQIQILKKSDVSGAQYGYLQSLGSQTAPTPVAFGDIILAPTTNSDKCWWIPINLRNASKYVKVQAKIATPGATPAQIDSSEYCFSK